MTPTAPHWDEDSRGWVVEAPGGLRWFPTLAEAEAFIIEGGCDG